jgi:hypothetical protein
MTTEISIRGTDFYINGEPTYKDRYHNGRRIEGLLLNSRMVQAIFDDENPTTRGNWEYPDTNKWDPARNTTEFCTALSTYREHGLLAVTVGLQGGGPKYGPDVYDDYINSAFHWNGQLKPQYFDRLDQVLQTADNIGMVVILNYFYWQQNRRFENDPAVRTATRLATEWIVGKGYKNVIVDINNEVQKGSGIFESERVHELIEIVQQTSINNQRLLAGTSIHPLNHNPGGKWSEVADLFFPHGNDSYDEKLRQEIRNLKASPEFQKKPRPILINEDSIDITNLDVAVDEGASWGFYSQGYGSGYQDQRWRWTLREREQSIDKLSGFQTPPVNWNINTDFKRAFFNRVKTISEG